MFQINTPYLLASDEEEPAKGSETLDQRAGRKVARYHLKQSFSE